VQCNKLPQLGPSIRSRVGEIVFDSSRVAEMQAITAVRALTSDLADVRMHRIGPPNRSLSREALQSSAPAGGANICATGTRRSHALFWKGTRTISAFARRSMRRGIGSPALRSDSREGERSSASVRVPRTG
jgi:hypothetical protein